MRESRFASRVFLWAGIYGVVGLVPLYFMEERLAVLLPPPLEHPEFFYGFLGVALAWQLVFLVIARDPARYRPIMLCAVVEKVGYGAAVLWLIAERRTAFLMAGSGAVDLLLAVLFLAAYMRTRATSSGLRR